MFSTPELNEVIDQFHNLDDEAKESLFIEKYETSKDVSIQGYIAVLEMKKAQYVFNPFSKLRIFKQSKKKLNSLIEENPKNVHLRYIRLMVEERTPAFLGYNTNIEEDKKFLVNVLSLEDESDFMDSLIYKNTAL